MKFIAAFVCLLFAAVSAQEMNCPPYPTNLTQGTCGGSAPCNHYCTGEPITDEGNCSITDYCCYNAQTQQCTLRQLPAGSTGATVDVDGETKQFLAIFQNGTGAAGGDDEGRSIGFGCPLPFPYICQLPPPTPQHLNAPFDIPYCQRIACSASNPFLDSNYQQCVSQPGCYFDQELFTYRSLVGQAILPGVPVCHAVIRNRAFQRRANEVAQVVGTWNPLLTTCVLNEYSDEIFGVHVGCELLKMLQYFGHTGKRAGWAGITERQCSLIGACYQTTATGGYCAYPTDLATGQPILRASSGDGNSRGRSSDLFGLPTCYPVNPSAGYSEFLSSYHTCLSSGCASSIDPETLIQNLMQAGSSLQSSNYALYLQYISMIHSGLVRPDNYLEMIEQLQSTPVFPIGYPSLPTLSPIFGGLGNPFGGLGNIPYSLGLGGGRSGNISTATPEPRFLGVGYPPQIGGGSSLLGGFPGGLPGGFPGGFPIHPTPDPCPFRPQQFYQPGLPQLTGSFAGCCDRPLCYLPKQDLYNPYSGISSYLTQWSSWGECNVPCGGGLKNRTRMCIGGYCNPNELMFQTQVCNAHICPYYMNWEVWGDCSVTCGGGSRSRSRICVGEGCVGPADETEPCQTGQCPTFTCGGWGSCSSTCGRGIQSRLCTCTHGGADGCPPDRPDQRPCEQFCDPSVVSCNPSSCCWEQTCTGHCQEDYRVGQACSVGFCGFRPAHQRCVNGGAYPNSFNFQG